MDQTTDAGVRELSLLENIDEIIRSIEYPNPTVMLCSQGVFLPERTARRLSAVHFRQRHPMHPGTRSVR